nr:MAG TPA: putative protease [Caudoviricetes sp.]
MDAWNKFFMDADGAGAGGGGETPPADGSGAGDGGPKNIFNAGEGGGGDNPPAGGEGGGDAGGGEGAPQVPENYEFNLGEGLTITDEQKAAFTAIAKEAKLTQAQADGLLKMHSEILSGYMHEAEEAVEKNIAECQKLGLTTKENLGYAKAAVDMFGGSDAMQVLVDTGAINHPAVCKLFVNIGQLISEDNPLDSHVGGGKTVRPEDVLFPNSKY